MKGPYFFDHSKRGDHMTDPITIGLNNYAPDAAVIKAVRLVSPLAIPPHVWPQQGSGTPWSYPFLFENEVTQ